MSISELCGTHQRPEGQRERERERGRDIRQTDRQRQRETTRDKDREREREEKKRQRNTLRQMVVAISSHAMIRGEGLTNHSPPSFFFLFSQDGSACTDNEAYEYL